MLNANAIKETIAKGVKEGDFAYVGKAPDGKYQPFYFQENSIGADTVEISDDIYLIKAEDAEQYKKEQADPPRLTTLTISPNTAILNPQQGQTFTVQGFDQHDRDIEIAGVLWTATGGMIDSQGTLVVGELEGNFTVTATVGAIASSVGFNVKKAPIVDPTDPVVIPLPPPPPLPAQPN